MFFVPFLNALIESQQPVDVASVNLLVSMNLDFMQLPRVDEPQHILQRQVQHLGGLMMHQRSSGLPASHVALWI